MKKLFKILGGLGAAALAAGLIPYRFLSDEDSGSYEVGGLLWSLKKSAGQERDNYTVEFFPGLGKHEQPDEEPAAEEPAAEEPKDEPAAEEPKEEAPAEEPKAEEPEVEA